MSYWWTIQFFIYSIFLSQAVQKITCYICTEDLKKIEVPVDESTEEDDYAFYYIHGTQWITSESMTTCSNISNITALPLEHFKVQKYQQYLKITESKVLIVPPSAFVRFHSITRLFLSGIHIQVVFPEAFRNLTRLQQLYLDNNELTVVSNNVYNSLKQLEVLKLGNNKIQGVEKNALVGTEKLLELYLNDNQLRVLDDDVFKTLQYLKVLDLSGNPLAKVDNWQTTSLQTLSLSRLSLEQFDLDLSNSTVKFLNLSANQLSTVDFSHLRATEQLDLSQNQIVLLENFTNFLGYWVNFDNNKIRTVTGSFRYVTELYLSHNQIAVLEGQPFNQSEHLRILDIGFNSISKINANVFLGLSSLDRLLLHHNNITTLEVGTFRNLTSLTVLDLSHNNIKEFQFGIFDSLRRLQTLDISNNKLVDLHQYTFNALSELSNLYFDNNKISSFDVQYLSQHLTALMQISLDKNPWSCQDLVKMQHVLRAQHVNIVEGESYDVENFHGIACINRKEFEEHHNTTSTHFQKALTKGVENFLSQELKDTKLFNYFSEKRIDNKFSDFLAAEKKQLERINSNKGLIAVSAIQVVISSLMLVLISFIFVYLKKVRLYRRSELSSQMELF